MKRFRHIGFLLSFFLFSTLACSEKTSSASEGADRQIAETGEGAGQEIVLTPDYAASAGPVREDLGQLLREYLQVTDALVSSDGETARKRASALEKAARQVPVEALEGEQQQYARGKVGLVQESAARMAATADVNAQREHLQPLSEAVFALTKAFGAHDETVYYQYCPMAFDFAGAYWVSGKREIQNPYFGASMLTCGSNEEVLQ